LPAGAVGAAAGDIPPLAAERIAMTYDDGRRSVPVIGEISFELMPGEIVSIVGPSGCGKTTLLNILSGLLQPSSGEVRWHGRVLPGMPPKVGYMLQKDLLFPWRTAVDNVMLGKEIRGEGGVEARDKARALLDQLGLHGFADDFPATLSGGMRQRVALARTLINEPDVLLLDEPFAALDFQTKLLIEGDTIRLVRDAKRAMLCITHDVEEAVSISDRVLVLTRRPTRIKSVYRIEIEGDRSDMMAARDNPRFAAYVRGIWRDLEVTQH
jgi:NitT/TauT family transport system ATP-binding protein